MDVNSILANKSSLPSSLVIKPDMSPQERAIESALLKERWSLIKGGLDRKSQRRSCTHCINNFSMKSVVYINTVVAELNLFSATPAQPMNTTHTQQPQPQERPPDDCPAISNYVTLNSKNSNPTKLKF